MTRIKDIFLWGPEQLHRGVQPLIKDISAFLWSPARVRLRVPPIFKDFSLFKSPRPQRRRRTVGPAKLKPKSAGLEPTIASIDAVRGSPNGRPGKLQYSLASTDPIRGSPPKKQIKPYSPIGSIEAVRENPNIRRAKLQSLIDNIDAVRRDPTAGQLEPQSRPPSTDEPRVTTKLRQRAPARQVIPKFLTKIATTVASSRKLITTAPRSTPRKHEFAAITPKRLKGRGVGAAGAFAISICFSLLVVCGILIPMLLIQTKDLKTDITLLKMRLAAVDAHFSQLESQQKTKEAKAAESPPLPPPPPRRQIQIALSNDEIKLIRGFIKVVPSQPGAQQKVQLGQEISNSFMIPVPASLVSQIAKLHGARFLVDDNGAIIISGEGSNHADVVVEPQ